MLKYMSFGRYHIPLPYTEFIMEMIKNLKPS